MDFQTIHVSEHGDGVHAITLYRPEKRNAISIRMREEISHCLGDLARSEEVRVVIFTGSGPSFSSGFDLREFKVEEQKEALVSTSMSYHRLVWNFPKPTLAAVNGFAMGGGFDLATLCDMRIGSVRAIFGHPEVKFGGHPIITPLRWIVGEGLARDLCLTGRHIDAREAHRIGLLSEVLPADELMDRALELARMIAEAPLQTLRDLKGWYGESQGKGFEESFRLEHDEPFRTKFLKT